MTDNAPETRLVDVKGRTIVVKQLKDAQLLLMSRDQKVLEDPKVDDRTKLNVAGGVLDMFESVIVQAEDRAYVLALTRAGELELGDFVAFLSAFRVEKEAEPVKPVVRRGRPRKAVK